MNSFIKRAIALCMCLILAFGTCTSFAGAEGSLKIEIGTVNAAGGDTVDVPVILADNPGIAGLQISVSYGEELTLNSITYTSGSETGLTSQVPQKLGSPVKLTWYNGTANSTYNGTVATLNFTVKSDVIENTRLPLTLTVNADDVADIEENNVPFTVTNGAVVLGCTHTEDSGTVTKEPTCTDKGVKTYKCTQCGEALRTEEISALGHSWDAGVTTKEATETETGEITYTCTRSGCGATKKEIIPKLNSETLGITVGTVKAKAGETVTVPVSFSPNPGVAMFEMTVNYEGPVTLTGSSCTIEGDFTCYEGTGKILWVNDNNELTEGEAFTLSFKVDDDAAEGEVVISMTDVLVANLNEEELATSVTNGKISIINRVPGDINGDDTINGMDLLRLKKYLVGMDVEIDESNADVTGDGQINGMDLLRLKKYLVGMDVILE